MFGSHLSTGNRWGGLARRKRLPGSPSFSPATRQAISPASRIWSTAAWRCKETARLLAVEPQQVVLGKTEAADRCFGLQTGMRAMPIVTMQPVEQLSRSLPGVLI